MMSVLKIMFILVFGTIAIAGIFAAVGASVGILLRRLPIRLRLRVENGWYRVLYAILALIAIGAVADGLFGPRHTQEGDPCGPFHHWIYVNYNSAGADLSCEPD